MVYFRFLLNKKEIAVLVLLAVTIVGLGIGLGYILKRKPPDEIVKNVGSVVSNGEECAAIGGLVIE